MSSSLLHTTHLSHVRITTCRDISSEDSCHSTIVFTVGSSDEGWKDWVISSADSCNSTSVFTVVGSDGGWKGWIISSADSCNSTSVFTVGGSDGGWKDWVISSGDSCNSTSLFTVGGSDEGWKDWILRYHKAFTEGHSYREETHNSRNSTSSARLNGRVSALFTVEFVIARRTSDMMIEKVRPDEG